MIFVALITYTIAQGYWSAKKNLLLSPTSAAHLPNGKILVWSANAATYYLSGSKGELYQIINSDGTYNPRQGLMEVDLPSMFCSGITVLANGDILINGGGDVNAPATAIFSAKTNKFTASRNMNIPRGYNANVMLTNGLVFTIGGSFNRPYGVRNGEVFNPATNRWTVFNNLLGDVLGARGRGLTSIDPQGIFRSDNHAWLAAWYNKATRKHCVFYLGPVPDVYLMDATAAPGSMRKLGVRPTPYSMNAACVMFSPGIYFAAGGATAYSTYGLAAYGNAVIINLLAYAAGKAQAPAYKTVRMISPRTFANAVVMPGGKIFVVGGQTRTYIFQDQTGVLRPELYDPKTETFTSLPPMAVARNYHSWALLMSDGKIMVGGGGLCVAGNRNGVVSCPKDDDDHIHNDLEIYTPVYITGRRPTIAFTKATVGNTLLLRGTINVKTSCTRKCTFELIKRSSVTHSTNNDQIRVPLTAFYVAQKKHYSLKIAPEYQDWVTNGQYMLFALEGESPSVAIDVYVDAKIR